MGGPRLCCSARRLGSSARRRGGSARLRGAAPQRRGTARKQLGGLLGSAARRLGAAPRRRGGSTRRCGAAARQRFGSARRCSLVRRRGGSWLSRDGGKRASMVAGAWGVRGRWFSPPQSSRGIAGCGGNRFFFSCCLRSSRSARSKASPLLVLPRTGAASVTPPAIVRACALAYTASMRDLCPRELDHV